MAPRVLVTAAGTAASYTILRTLRRRLDGVVLVAADSSPAHLVASSTLADAFQQVPPVRSPDFEGALLEIVRAHAVDVVWPILDPEVVLAADLRAAGRLPVTHAPAPPTARCCLDKLALSFKLREQGIPTPVTEEVSVSSGWRGRPSVVKLRHGWGSNHVWIARTPAQWGAAMLLAQELDEPFVVQPVCRTPEVTVDGFRSRDGGRTHFLCRQRLEVKAGVCVKALLFQDAVLEDLAARVARGLGLTGAFCIQMMRHATSEDWVVTDVNPRPGAATAMSITAGFDPVTSALLDLLGEPPQDLLQPLSEQMVCVRHWEEQIMPHPPPTQA